MLFILRSSSRRDGRVAHWSHDGQNRSKTQEAKAEQPDDILSMDVPLLDENNAGLLNPMNMESISDSTKSAARKRKNPVKKGTFSGMVDVKIVNDFSKVETEEIDGSTSTQYSFVVHYDRWKCLAACFYLEFCFGLVAYFPKYIRIHKDALQLSQTELSWLSNIGIIGLNTYFLPGMFVDRIVPSKNIFVGVVIASIGYFGVYLTRSNGSFGVLLSVKWVLYVFFFLLNHGMTWIDLTTSTTVVKNFPLNKGLASGLVLAQAGLAPLCMLVFDRGFFGKQNIVDMEEKPFRSASSMVSCKQNRYVAVNILNKAINLDSNNSISYSENTSSTHNTGITILFVIGLIILFVGSIASIFMRFPHKNILTSNKLGSGGKAKIYLVYGVTLVTLIYCTVESVLDYLGAQNSSSKPSVATFCLLWGYY